MDSENRVLLVTGGASGLGRATVEQFLRRDGKAAVLDVDKEKGKALEEEQDGDVVFFPVDVTDESQVQDAVDQTIDAFGRLDVVVNCAGIAIGEKVLGREGPHDLSSYRQVIEVNLIGTFNTIRLASEAMADNDPNEEGERGVVVNTASVAAFEGQIGQAAYSSSKGGVVGLTLPVSREMAEYGIRVMTIAPGMFETPMFAGLPEKVIASLEEMIPFPSRLGRPAEYAQLVESIVVNPMLNGEVIRLDGGVRMQPR